MYRIRETEGIGNSDAAHSLLLDPDGDRRLELAPLRGVRFAARPTRDLGPETAPPDAHQDPGVVRRLLDRTPHNVIRLVPHGRTGLDLAAGRLHHWLDRGVLAADPEPALYVYQQTRDGHVLQRGLVGALGIREEEDRVVLPHEDVFAGPVAERLELTRSATANLEPLYCVHQGAAAAARVVEDTARTAPPVTLATAEDGITHSLRRVTDPAALRAVADDLAGRQVLIADGHHRYAAYQALRREHREAGHGRGPWDYGLALLVDMTAYPVPVDAVHRVLPGLSVREAAHRARGLCSVRRLTGGLSAAHQALAAAGRTGNAFLLSGHGEHHLVTGPGTPAPHEAGHGSRSASRRQTDTAVLHHFLIPLMLGDRAVAAQDVRPHRGTPENAVTEADRWGGTAVIVNPVSLDEVFARARAGERMPHKSTAFGLKPRTGMVLRTFTTGPS
ncbi:DUF1015 domain-containing protein [Streptomyces sp. NPDC002588]|uniref:DUF1015 domain-containing protein n=1 Tax=Streptomyces sp. NPDC002588 TaxID=3154419 RepID=UPI0033174AA5